MIKKRTIVAIGLIIILISSLTTYYLYPWEPKRDINPCELERDINSGMSIMGLWPHPDDECYTPGVFPYASSKGCKCWVVVLVSLDSPPYSDNPEIRAARVEANQWFEDNYLEEYINLNMLRVQPPGDYWHGWTWSYEEIKAAYKAVIEEKKPDILLTFSPYGWHGGVEHINISEMVTDLLDELSYTPKVYWFINTWQGPNPNEGEQKESDLYPPTDSLNLDVYSDKLGKTYWEAKVEFWWKYAPSLGSLNNWLNTPGNLENNDRHEYFVKYQ